MKGKKINSVMILGIALLLITVGGIAMMASPDREPDTVLTNRFGDVIWNHELHVRMKEISGCTVCHHTERQGALELRPCSDCHHLPQSVEGLITPELFTAMPVVEYQGEDGPPTMTALHKPCRGCHQAMKQGPTACRDCHKQTFTGPHGIVEWDHRLHSRKLEMDPNHEFENDCESCHHQQHMYVDSAADYRSCRECHRAIVVKGLDTATNIKDHKGVRHGECQTCHVKFNPEEDNVQCVHCHEGWIVDLETSSRSLEQAVHERCSTCHNSEDARFNPNQPGVCSDCHKPDPSRIEIPGMGIITWGHRRHVEFRGIACINCHHTEAVDEPMIACRACHADSLKESLDKTCLDCHKQEGVGLTSLTSIIVEDSTAGYYKFEGNDGTFWWDHRFHAVDISLSCQDCHHNTIVVDGVFATAAKSGKAWMEEDGTIQNCANCHGRTGPVTGSVAEGTKAPGFEEAYEIICQTCHQALASGRQEWKEYFKPEPLKIR